MNEEALAHWGGGGLLRQKKINKIKSCVDGNKLLIYTAGIVKYSQPKMFRVKVTDLTTFLYSDPIYEYESFNELNYTWNKAGIHPSIC